MDEQSLSTSSSFSGMTEMAQTDVRNCLSLAMDPDAAHIVELTADIEEQLGLVNDMDYRLNRLSVLRQSAMEQCVFPMMLPEFSADVIKYEKLLTEKRAILQSIYNCCEEFCVSMKSEVDLVCSGEEHKKDGNTNLSRYCIRNQSSNECSEVSSETEKRQKRNRLPSYALHILWDFLRTHKNNPYPTTQQKEQLAKETNLTITQIRNWFTNTRKRKLTQSPDSDEDYSVESDRGDSPPSSRHYETGRSRRRLSRKRTSGNTCFVGRNGFHQPPLLEKKHSEESANTKPDSDSCGHGQWIQYGPEGLFPFRDARLFSGDRRTPMIHESTPHGMGFDPKRFCNSSAVFELSEMPKEFCLNNGFPLACKKQNSIESDPSVPVCA